MKSPNASTVGSSVAWKLAERSRNVHEICFPCVSEGWEQFVLLQSDEHWDNPHCDRAKYLRHLKQARERNAPIIKYGDLFCAMQGKFDKRSSKSDIRPEHMHGNYLDSLVSTAADYHEAFADLLAVVGPGNHETSILKHCETNLTERFVQEIKHRAPRSQIAMGGFSGWVRFRFTIRGTQRQSVRLWYHHGYGGGGPVTRDVIQSARRAAYAEAEIICTGHTHDEWVLPIQRIRLNNASHVEQYRQLHIKTPGYKDEYADGAGGWHIERGGPPKPTGAAWLRFWYSDRRVHVEAREAQ